MGQVSIRDLRKDYQERRQRPRIASDPATVAGGARLGVLDDVNLEIEEGELACILGPSGCGKSTLLRIVAGFDEASSGQVLIDGGEVAGPSPHHIFVFQH